MALFCPITLALLLFLVESLSCNRTEEADGSIYNVNTTVKGVVTYPILDSEEVTTVSNADYEYDLTSPHTEVDNEDVWSQYPLITMLQNLRSKAWHVNLQNTTVQFLQLYLVPVFYQENVQWAFRKTKYILTSTREVFAEENLGWVYNATLNTMDSVIPLFSKANLHSIYNQTLNAIDMFLISPKRFMYTTMAVAVAMSPVIISWFQALVTSFIGFIDSSLFVATGRGLSRSLFWSAYPDFHSSPYAHNRFERSSGIPDGNSVSDILFEVARVLIEYVGDMYFS
ncbi:hypothetical protein SK128_015809 [Halocaridina rubra]|uniref:Uncharacterized protein n=1 Tax=Halocaridina rubra TaxID=373956 RepID=A0AAN8XF65_HALRR